MAILIGILFGSAVAVLFPGRLGRPLTAAKKYLERHPDDLIGFGVASHLMRLYQQRGATERYKKQLAGARERAKRLGVSLTVETES